MPAMKWAMYVDGYNFYYAIKNRLPVSSLPLGWCDFGKLARLIINARGELAFVKYFTAPVGRLGKMGGEHGGERQRQSSWLRAVATIPRLEIVEGFYNGDFSDDPSERHKSRSEKETDTNIAINLVLDAAKRLCDRAILLGGDYDQMPSVRAVTKEFHRPIEVWLPPGQAFGAWKDEFGSDSLVSLNVVTAEMLATSRLSDSLRDKYGDIEMPPSWRARDRDAAS